MQAGAGRHRPWLVRGSATGGGQARPYAMAGERLMGGHDPESLLTSHAGTEKAVTPGGVSVRNVALPVLRRAYAVYCLGSGGAPGCP
jgi:hypothetical protein